MDGSHITNIELEKYAREGLAPAEFLRVHAHIENCDECKRRIENMFPTAVVDDLTTLLDDGTIDTQPEFHLNYEDHLKPYVEENTGPIEKELIEGHAEICLSCREDLQDIVSFHHELKQESDLRHLTEGSKFTNLSAWLFTSTRRMVWVAVAGLIIVIGSGSIWYYTRNQGDSEAVVRNVEFAQVPSVDRSPSREPSIQVPADESTTMATRTEKGIGNYKNGDETETATLKLPGLLKELRDDSSGLRGSEDDTPQKIELFSPNGIVIRNLSPVLRWRRVPNVQSYEIALFDSGDNRIGGSDLVSDDNWRGPKLKNGKLYQWQVVAINTSLEGKSRRYIGKGKFYVVSQQDENRIAQAKDSLARGTAYAEAGLLKDAVVEFRRYLALNPGSEIAKSYLRQVQAAQR